jgi:hypothetical protein
MSFDATCHCPKCSEFWYECATDDETFTCPKCGHKEIEPEEIDSYCLDMDEGEELAAMEWVKEVTSKKQKERLIESQN